MSAEMELIVEANDLADWMAMLSRTGHAFLKMIEETGAEATEENEWNLHRATGAAMIRKASRHLRRAIVRELAEMYPAAKVSDDWKLRGAGVPMIGTANGTANGYEFTRIAANAGTKLAHG